MVTMPGLYNYYEHGHDHDRMAENGHIHNEDEHYITIHDQHDDKHGHGKFSDHVQTIIPMEPAVVVTTDENPELTPEELAAIADPKSRRTRSG